MVGRSLKGGLVVGICRLALEIASVSGLAVGGSGFALANLINKLHFFQRFVKVSIVI